ncbi:MAG: cupin domain-containing protein, partial [Candidatus Eremiobacteraeota bacterium]|nr:cupin domain-containing protein [Candidatus Eremiobacteraeota bacterium]
GVAFAAGIGVGRAQQPPVGWGPTVIHVGQMTPEDFPAPAVTGAARVKIVARNDGAAVQAQMGPTQKHYHANSNEVQYITEGSGMFWLGDTQVPVGPGDLIIIPKGTAHGMNVNYRAIAFKSPPQAPDDIHPLP